MVVSGTASPVRAEIACKSSSDSFSNVSVPKSSEEENCSFQSFTRVTHEEAVILQLISEVVNSLSSMPNTITPCTAESGEPRTSISEAAGRRPLNGE